MKKSDTCPIQSIIIPTYNRKNMLAEALESVLKQSQHSLEVLIIDDCSTDGTEEFVKSIQDGRVKYFCNEVNSGPEFSRNFGLRCSRGKYITFLDDDDYYTDYDFFAKAIKIFDEEDNLVFVCANAKNLIVETGEINTRYNIGSPGRVCGTDFILKNQEYRKPLSTFPTVFKADALRQAGLEEKILFDTTTYWEAALLGDAWFISDYIGVYRTHKESMTLGYSKHINLEARGYATSKEYAKRRKMLINNLGGRVEQKILDSWYINKVLESLSMANNKIKALRILLAASGFMPKLWLCVIKRICKSILRRLKIINNN